MPTPYKVFLSVPDDPIAQTYLGAARTAVWCMDQMMISAMNPADIAQTGEGRILLAKQVMETTALFIGIYGRQYGAVAEDSTMSYAEQEYRLAFQRGILAVVFMSEDSRTTTDERVIHFRTVLEVNHIITWFTDLEDLRAKVILAVDNFLRTSRQLRLLPPQQALGQVIEALSVPAASVDTPQGMTLETLVNEGMKFAADDIDQIVRRALQVWDAQKIVTDLPNDGWLRVTPIFGEPSLLSQFASDVFIIMPFRPTFEGIYETAIRPVISSLNMTIKRGDDFSSVTGVIMSEVWSALNGCKLVIAELTEINANVFYELGIAHTLGKPAILLTQATEVTEIPFDLRHLRFIQYANTIEGGKVLAKELRDAIVWIMNDLKETNG